MFENGKDIMYIRPSTTLKYSRDKQKNQELVSLASDLNKNLTVSRVEPHRVSVRTSFLAEMQNCMDELSNQQLLLFDFLEYLCY